MLNDSFKKIASQVKGLTKKAEGIFGLLIVFVHDHSGQGHEHARQVVREQEKLANAEMKIEMGKNSTYKVSKNLLLNCVEAGIPLKDASGNFKGKTQLEDELAATKEPKTPMELFKRAMAAAEKHAAFLNDGENITAAAMADSFAKSLISRIKAAA